MSSTFIEHSPETDGDKSLILIMDGEGNITADRAHFEKIVSNQKIPDLGIKIVRLDSNHIGSDSNSESKQELKLTVEEIYAESLPLGLGDQTVMSSPLEILPGPSTENLGHDIVDPFSQMDPEQLQRLEHALASEQAKQILGENVAAMFDMLSVDDSPAAFLRNSIKNDHCYTNLLPSSDPNGPSFFMNDNRSETSRKGKAKVGTPVKGKKTLTNGPSGNDVKKGAKEWQNVKQKQSTMLDYGVPMKMEEKQEEEDVDVEESEASVGEEEEEEEDDEGDDDNLSDEDYSNRSSGRGKRKKRHRKKVVVKKSGLAKTVGRGWVGKAGRFGRRSTITPEVRARNEKLNETMSKIVQSMGVDKGDDKSDLKKGMKKMKTLRTKSKDELPENEKAKEIQKTTEEVLSPAKSQPTKYPKRENRKPPAHLADAFGPALFSTPDIIRRVTTTNDDVPQTPPEKKNFTVGAKLSDRGITKPGKSEPQNTKPKEPVKVPKSKEDSSQPVVESLDQKTSTPKSETSNPEVKKTYLELKKLIEKQQVKASDYEDHDYSDENIDEIYLDPTQMDQSLLEGFSQTVSKSEDQLLQEAILLQEQLIESNKGILIPESEVENLEDTQERLGFGTETIEDIQNEITSSILVVQEQPKQDNFQLMPGSNDLSAKKSALGETESESLTGDDSKEERRRNSAKRRRSDEVSDLDSDLDDALSEASWNSEDDPDRLWCICRKPHNNRFMICCDVCEEWFHGKCVGITKTIGKQMEQDGLEWSCPNCTKKKKAEEYEKEAEKIRVLKEKMAQSIKDQQQKIKESQKLKNQSPGGKEKITPKLAKVTMKQTKISDFSHGSGNGLEEEETVGRKCIMCKGPVRENSIYCSDDCIRKHSQHAISQLVADSNKKITESSGQGVENSKATQKIRKDDPRIVVMDSNSKKFLVGQNAPTAANLTTWLKENPSYHVVYKKTDKPGRILLTSRKVVKIQEKPKEPQKVLVQAQKPEVAKSTQLKLAVSPNSKQINILQPGAKKVYQLVNTSGTGAKQTAYVVKPKQTEIIEALPFPVKTVFAKGVQLKVKEAKEAKEATSPKSTTQAQTPTSKESPVDKQEKVPKKRKERTQKFVDAKMGTSVKPEEGKEKEKKDTDQAIRESVKKTLADTLKARVQENKNMEFNEKHIEELAVRIEEKLYKHFENKVDTKYKSKYRSLVFNIKDPKNETLYKKIVDNSISPKELVKLSPEELASQELARWREKENQHQLEMIKMTELELMTKGNTYIMKSHKGEQVIESDQKVAAVAAEIDPNVPAQELVSALNSVTSTTQEGNEEEGKGKEGTGLLKLKKDKERKRSRSRDKKRSSRDRDRSSSKSSRSRSRRSKDRKRSRSRDRDKDRSKSRHREKKMDKKEKDAGEKEEEKSERNEVLTTEEEKFKKIEEDEEDRMPSSTVIIKTPEIEPEEPESLMLWKGAIVMADVAKFNGVAKEVSGDCFGLCYDIPGKVDVVGRIPFDTVWDYIARMKKMGTKDILVIKVVPQTEDERPSYVTLYNYLSKRARIGVVGKTSDAVKDFYLYPLASQSPLPQVLSPSDGSSFEAERENVILGVIVRNKHRNSQLEKLQRSVRKTSSVDVDVSEVPVDRSYTPPLPDKDVVRQKRKIRVHVDFKSTRKSNEEDEEEEEEEIVQEEEERLTKPEDYESPYSPEDSDDDVPPLPKIAKPSPSVFGVSPSISKLLSPGVSGSADSLQDPAEIQKKIEEINRAIEEQTQQIQSLTSAVPKLGFGAIPGLPSAAPPPVDKVHLPLISESDESNNQRSFTPPLVIEKNISFLPEVTRKISLPSNLQEILNSIQKKSGNEEESPKEMAKTVEEVVKTENSDVKISPAVLEQTSSLLPGLEEKPATESTLSKLTDQELLQKVQEMEMDMAPCLPQPRPPGVDDIPLLPFANPPPPPLFSQPSTETKKSEKKKLDLKSVFENEGVPNFNIPGPGWDDKRGPKQKPFKIDIKLAMNTLEKKTIDVDHFDIESISAFPSGSGTTEELHDERLYPKPDERFRNPQERNRRRSDERDWKYDRRLWDDGRRYKEDYRRHGRRDRPKFHKSSRHLQKDWEGSGKSFEERQRWRNQEMRREEVRRARKRADSAS